MPWCPNCRIEYREGFAVCSDCGTQLVDDSQMEQLMKVRNKAESDGAEPGKTGSDAVDEPAFLMNVADELEANSIIALLESEQIPAYAAHVGTGDYLNITWGMSVMGVNVFVPASALEKAKEIIQSVSGDSNKFNDEEFVDTHEGNDDADYSREETIKESNPRHERLVLFYRIIIALWIISLIYVLIQNLFQL